jgi:quinol monooxygenase YgiN
VIVVIARVKALADKADELAGLLAPLAAASRGDAGCQSYAFYRDVEDPTLFCSVETWDSRADLDAHMTQAHTAELLSRLPGLVAGAPTIHAHEVASTDQVA